MPEDPELSIILVASRGRKSIARILECLQGQTVAEKMEVVVAARPEYVRELAGINPDAFADFRVVAADFSTSARARVPAIEASHAPVVVFAEDHAFPRDSTWASRLIDAHRSPHAAVGPTMGNANPGSSLSWATLLCEYGPWLGGETISEASALPGHNSSYKRSVLTRYQPALADHLEAEWILQRSLRAEGETLLLLGDVKVDRVNFSRAFDAMGITFWGGWMFAASRAADWSVGRRISYSLAAPLICAIRIWRALGHKRNCSDPTPPTLRILPALSFLMVANSVGEALGHALGDCGLREQLARREFDRWRHIRSDERALLAATA